MGARGPCWPIVIALTLLAPALAFARPAASKVAAGNVSLIKAIERQAGEPEWRYIVLHHTAAEKDSLAGISAGHAKRFSDPLGIQYHFLIGNGNSAADGEIQIARWRHRALSIHVVHPERAPTAITISLQGNLHTRMPSSAQMLAVETLTRRLMQVYAIPVERISTNTRVDGTFTVCPGRYFPIDRLLWRLGQASVVALADWQDPLAAVPMAGPFADLAAIRASLRWDTPCKQAIPVTAAQILKTVKPGNGVASAHLLAIDGGRGCTPISRRLLALQAAAGWFAVELDGYRTALVKGVRGAVQVRDGRGVMQVCAVAKGGGSCAPTRPPGRKY